MVGIKIRPHSEKKITAKRGEVYLIRFDPLIKGKFKKIVKNTEIKNIKYFYIIQSIKLKTRIRQW